MYLTLAMVVFFASIVVFFSEEFIRAFKKIFAIRGAKTLIPLALASWAVYTFDYWFLWAIYYYKELLHHSLDLLKDLIPFKTAVEPIALVLLLTLISVVPVLIINLIKRRKSYIPYQYGYLTSTLIWITSAVLLLALKN